MQFKSWKEDRLKVTRVVSLERKVMREEIEVPTEYKRKGSVCRGEWSEQDLQQAIEAVQEGRVGVREARIYNVDETGLQMNNKPGFVIAQRGSKNVSAVTSAEKGETISVITSCNAEGSFIPPTCIFKGKNQKPEFADGMPPGSLVCMSEKSAYVNNVLFLRWLKEQFVPRKPPGYVIATGIVPFNPSAIPDYAYLTDKPQVASPNEPESQVSPNGEISVDNRNESAQDSSIIEILESVVNDSAGPSDMKTPEKEIDTPGKILDKINPIPITEAVSSARKRGGQLASVLTSSDNIRNKKKKLEEKLQAEAKKRKKKENKKCIKPGPSRIQSKSKKLTHILKERWLSLIFYFFVSLRIKFKFDYFFCCNNILHISLV
ncbi:unnamed protein product [Acanthoscelides obtectus]|uniref:DDE-1 domain-containing protein n=1 Tax=Acanthoscelides obtectus TaxID=200917 RepID=A0A9P0NU55_ACAOB|nr:unnamed protein product [Acanthoscelides obtectus]CAK1679404.1 hypothetical protein AOBTE_LOCUS32234 [Acanthoscelides obtectus]